jgi:hypothetical protein
MTKRTRHPDETEEDYAEYEENYKAKRRAYRNALTRKKKTRKKQAAAEIAGTIQRGEEISPAAVRSYHRRAGRGSAPAEAARRLSDPSDWVQEPRDTAHVTPRGLSSSLRALSTASKSESDRHRQEDGVP